MAKENDSEFVLASVNSVSGLGVGSIYCILAVNTILRTHDGCLTYLLGAVHTKALGGSADTQQHQNAGKV